MLTFKLTNVKQMNKLLSICCILCSFNISAQFTGSGRALDFNGSSDYVEMPHNSAQNPTTAFTVEAWIKADTWKTNIWEGTIVSKDTWSSISEGWVIRCGNSGRLSFNLALNNTNSWYEVTTASIMSLNKWYHVAGTYDGATLRLYLNGDQVGTFTQAGTITPTTVPVKIGNIARPSTSRHFDGEIDEVRMWSATLSQATLRDYMCRRIDASHPDYNQLISLYNIDQGTGNAVNDASGNSLNGTRYGATWTYSGAHLGSESTYLYANSWSGKSVVFGHSNGDSVTVSSISGNPDGIHVYRIDNHPNFQSVPPGVLYHHDDRYWGVYPTSGTNVDFTFSYNYQGYGVPNQAELNLSHRDGNNDQTWTGIQSVLDTIQHTLTKTNADPGQFIMGVNDFLLPFDLISPLALTMVQVNGSKNTTVDFEWESTRLGAGTPATYEWVLDFDTADFSTPLDDRNSASSGQDTTLGVTYQRLADEMGQNDLLFGDTLYGKWIARATAGPVTRFANQAHDILFVRGIIDSDRIFPFSLDKPENDDTIRLYNGGQSSLKFNWERANTTAGGDGIAYELQLTGHSGDFNNPLLTKASDNSGLDTVVTFTEGELASVLQTNNIQNGLIFRFKWRVEASLSTLSDYSLDSQMVYLYREDDPFAGVNDVRTDREVELYPVPAGDKLWIRSAVLDGKTAEISLFDYTGKVVHTEKLQLQRETAIELTGMNAGVYFMNIGTYGTHKRLKFVIVR